MPSIAPTASPRFPTNRFWPDPGNQPPAIRLIISLGCLAVAWLGFFVYDLLSASSGRIPLLKQALDMLSDKGLCGLYYYGWGFFLGAVLLLIVHGLGYSCAAKVVGLKLSLKTFLATLIPFLGAHSVLRNLARNMWMEALVALGGPIFGLVVSLAASLIFHLSGNYLYLAIAYFGYFFNLISLTPLAFFDGNRVVAAFTRTGWIFGYLSVVVLEIVLSFRQQILDAGQQLLDPAGVDSNEGLYVHCNTFPLFILALALPQAIHAFLGTAPRRDLECTASQRLTLTIVYFSLLLALGWMSAISFELLWTSGTPETMGD